MKVAVAGTIPHRKASLDPTDSWCLSSLYELSYAIEAFGRDLRLDLRKRGGCAATPKPLHYVNTILKYANRFNCRTISARSNI